MMNFKSQILKLSIIFMLVLVLIPVASAMDSEDAFYQEYDVGDSEGLVEEYSDLEVEYTQVEVSSDSEYEAYSETENEESISDQTHEQLQETEDAVEISEFELDSEDNIYNNIIEEQNIDEVMSDDIAEEVFEDIIDDIAETCGEELTLDEISVNQGSIFISKYDANINSHFIGNMIFNGSGADKSTNFDRNLFKIIKLKNNLLIKHDVSSTNNVDDDAENVIMAVSVDNIRNDFAYSIDNSIVGDNHAVDVMIYSSFLNFDSCFDAIFCCNFLRLVNYFSGNFLTFENYFSGNLAFVNYFCCNYLTVEDNIFDIRCECS